VSLNRRYNAICPIHIKSCVLHAKSHVSLPSYYGSTCQRMTPVVPRGLTPATQERYLQSYTLPIQSRKMPEPNGVNSVPSKVMMMMTTIQVYTFWITSHIVSSAGFGYFVVMSCIEVWVCHNVIKTEVRHGLSQYPRGNHWKFPFCDKHMNR
jgi:hypothetical protein